MSCPQHRLLSRVALTGLAALPLAAFLLVAPLLAACHGRSDAAVDASPPAPSASALASGHPSASTSARPPPPPLPHCRAISVVGTSTLTSIVGKPFEAGAPTIIAESADIPDDAWVDLQATAKFTARHPRSARETTFFGPGRVRSCVGRAEEAWIGSGRFDSVVGSGERPGAEEWVVTPTGVIRYGSAKLELEVSTGVPNVPDKTVVKLQSGTVYTWSGNVTGPVTPPEVLPPGVPAMPSEGWTRLDGARSVTLSQKTPLAGAAAIDAAIDTCKATAKAASDLGHALAAPDAALGQIGPKHVIARHLARAACDVALVRVSLEEPSPTREAYYATLRQAETEWKGQRPHGGHGHLP